MDEKLNKIVGHSECPPGDTLRKYVQGKLSGTELRSLEEHLASCEMCSDEVDGMAFINNPEKVEADVTFLKQQIQIKLSPETAKKNIPMYLKIAAAILFLFVTSIIVYLIINNNSLTEKSLLSLNTNSDLKARKETHLDDKKPLPQEEKTLKEETEKADYLEEKNASGKKTKATIIDAIVEDSESEILSEEDKNLETKFSKAEADGKSENSAYGAGSGSGKAAVTKSAEKVFIVSDIALDMKSESSKSDNDETLKKQIVSKKDNATANEQLNVEGNLLAGGKTANEDEPTVSKEKKRHIELDEKKKADKDREKSAKKEEEQKRASGESKARKKADKKNKEMPASAIMISQDATTGSTAPIDEAMQAFENKNYSKAADLFEEIIKNEPANNKAIYYCGLSFYNAEKINKSIKLFEALLNMSVSVYTEDAGYYLSLIYIKKNENEKAKKLLQDIISKNGKRKADAEKKLKEIE
ncbi:MAG: hypothetical protein A2275_08825 [Bacteroidetes bacterium RIFOXYA12_FULL_35_11]|nr:MAG: hypothetical protein A2X01_05950 [Bacteroidetes bacterium GWF2_35_48]OFY82903.1 MAG: hypothetical protein A2275_08825 [Bacteroidetes bacterium RIFOXYA12_FULL_35_11]HBX52785.1 hypothetical protein [Bacteroidales bacterium]